MGLWLRENVVDGKGVAVDGDDRYRSLADIDVTRDQSSAWQSIAWIPDALSWNLRPRAGTLAERRPYNPSLFASDAPAGETGRYEHLPVCGRHGHK